MFKKVSLVLLTAVMVTVLTACNLFDNKEEVLPIMHEGVPSCKIIVNSEVFFIVEGEEHPTTTGWVCQSSSNSFVKQQESKNIAECVECSKPVVETQYSENPAIEPLQPKDWIESTNYDTIFKGELNGIFYCGAKNSSVSTFPQDMKVIETSPKTSGDGNYITADPTNEYSLAHFCSDSPEKHFAPSGTKWTIVLLEANGFVEAPLQ